MTAANVVLTVLISYAALWSTYVLSLPLLARVRPRGANQVASVAEHPLPTIAIIVPAHNMENEIASCLSSLSACDYPTTMIEVFVVADHCVDETAKRAAAAGAPVMVRDEGSAGKTFSIAWALARFKELGLDPDLYVITDATARVDAGFLMELSARWRAGEEIIVGHSVVDTENQRWFAQCLGLTLVHRNLQNWSRERLKLSALIEGRGMAYSRAYVQRFGWGLALPTSSRPGVHPTEDWRHGVRAAEHGYRVSFADRARVITPLRGSLGAATRQNVRWERGRMANAGTHGLRLLVSGLQRRDRLMTFAALDAIQPPVAILAAICLAAAMLTALIAESNGFRIFGLVPLFLVIVYGLLVVARGQREGIKARTVVWAPIYVVWRCLAFVLAWSPFGPRNNPETCKADRERLGPSD